MVSYPHAAPGAPGTLAICTIVSKNYIAYARVLAESFRRHNPGPVYVLLVDKIEGAFDPAAEPFEVLELEDLRHLIPEFNKFCFQYTILELNTAAKPYLLAHLFATRGHDKLAYFDPDILITAPLDELGVLLGPHNIVVTPHLTMPLEDGKRPDELDILRSGTYNLGFVAMARGAETDRFLGWWQRRLAEFGASAPERGLFTDQKWIDLAPGLWQGVYVLREPGYNVAYWNYHDRRVEVAGDLVTVNGKTGYFFHFSGVDPEQLEPVSKHQNRYTLTDLPAIRPLFELYGRLILARGHREARGWPYYYGRFANGVPIPAVARRLYLDFSERQMGDKVARFGNPFATGEGSFYSWLNAPVSRVGGAAVTNLLYYIYENRPDLVGKYPDILGADFYLFADWLLRANPGQYNLDEAFLAPLREALAREPEGSRLRRQARAALRGVRDSRPYQATREAATWLLGGSRFAAVRRVVRHRLLGRLKPRPGPPAGAPPVRALGVNVAGYLRTESGMGEAGRGLARAMAAAQLPLAPRDISLNVVSRREDATLGDFSDANPHDVNLLVVNADQVQAVAEQLGQAWFAGRYNVGFWLWESTAFPDRWLPAFDRLDEVWTPSNFCASAIAAASPVPVTRIPLPVEVPADVAPERETFGIPGDRPAFLFMFDFLSVARRKNPEAVVAAFRCAFAGGEAAYLVLKVINADRDPAGYAALREAAAGLPVTFIDRYLARAEVQQLIASCDTYVSLHRAEGFGLTIAEAMALGKPVIATAYSANTDFMTVNNSFPVRYDLVTLAEDVGPYPAGTVWADPDVAHAGALMRQVAADPAAAGAIGRRARQDVAALLSPEAVGAAIRARLARIAARAR